MVYPAFDGSAVMLTIRLTSLPVIPLLLSFGHHCAKAAASNVSPFVVYDAGPTRSKTCSYMFPATLCLTWTIENVATLPSLLLLILRFADEDRAQLRRSLLHHRRDTVLHPLVRRCRIATHLLGNSVRHQYPGPVVAPGIWRGVCPLDICAWACMSVPGPF